MRWFRQVSCVVVICFTYGPVLAEETAGKFLELLSGNNRSAKVWFAGVGNGFSWANSMLISSGQTRLYCPPENLTITTDQEVEIFKSGLEHHPKWKEFPAGLIMLKSLIETFPCKN